MCGTGASCVRHRECLCVGGGGASHVRVGAGRAGRVRGLHGGARRAVRGRLDAVTGQAIGLIPVAGQTIGLIPVISF